MPGFLSQNPLTCKITTSLLGRKIMSNRILVNGAFGKMGQACCEAIEAAADLILAGKAGREDDLASKIKQCDANVVVEFTNPAVVFNNTQTIISNGAHPVVGSTGLSPQQISQLSEASAKAKLGGVIAPNFSIGAILMMRFSAMAAKYFSHAEIIELHHTQKHDAPSGTAIKTAELMAEANKKFAYCESQHNTIEHSRGGRMDNIAVHSVRLPGLLAHQQVLLGAVGETLTIKHDSSDRSCFMPGVLLACRRVVNERELFYGLDHFID